MQKTSESWLLMPDSRGRLQLPTDLRGFPLYRIRRQHHEFRLEPLEAKAAEIPALPVQPWLEPEVAQFIQKRLIPKLASFKPLTSDAALVLYGSRARGGALQRSDFDLAVFIPRILSFRQKHSFEDAFLQHFAPEFAELRTHGIQGEPAFVFLPTTVPEALPSLYASIATDGVVWQDPSDLFAKWKSSVLRIMKRSNYRREGRGKMSKWTWTQGD